MVEPRLRVPVRESTMIHAVEPASSSHGHRQALVDLPPNRIDSSNAMKLPDVRVKQRRSERLASQPVSESDCVAVDDPEIIVIPTDDNTIVVGNATRVVSVEQDSDQTLVKSKRPRSHSLPREELQLDVAAQPAKRCRVPVHVRRSARLKRNSQETNYSMVCSPFDPNKFTIGMAEHDIRLEGQTLEAPEYVTDIYQWLFRLESKTRPYPYMHKQTKINAEMRMIVVDWLVEVHQKYRLEPPTLHLSVNIFDRYLSVETIERSKLQLLGVTSLLLACKFEEIYPPTVKDCVYITDKAYTAQDVLDMEKHILDKLKFHLSVTTSYPFVQRFLHLLDASPTMRIAANYYSDRVLQEYDFLSFRPSLIASAAVCLAVNHSDIRVHDSVKTVMPGIPNILLDYTGFQKAEILEVASLMTEKISEEVVTVSMRELFAVKHKYSSSRYDRFALEFDPPVVEDLMTDE